MKKSRITCLSSRRISSLRMGFHLASFLFLLHAFSHVETARPSLNIINDSPQTSSIRSARFGSDSYANTNKHTINSVPLSDIDSKQYESTMKCLHYNRSLCDSSSGKEGCGTNFEICRPIDVHDSRQALCYALWRNSSTEGVQIEFKGCWFGSSKSCSNEENSNLDDLDQCVQTHPPKTKIALYFCCCSGLLCNRKIKQTIVESNFSIQPIGKESLLGSEFDQDHHKLQNFTFYFLLILGLCFLIGVVSMIVYFYGLCRHKPTSNEMPTNQPLLDNFNMSPTGYLGSSPIQLKEIRAHGKFGNVWRGIDGRDNQVAVKVFNIQDRNSWQIEKEVYSLPQMQHNNILNYLGSEIHGEGLNIEYWIITEFHANGSLYDFLKSHTLNLNQLFTIIYGIGQGLSHLHEEIPANSKQGRKPSIAHRDFKSKNVLLSSNFRPCIADFGLALVFHPNATCGDAHGQVGTRRYMAPEVLEGAISFTRDAFLKIDIYACGLVLWELLSRCCFDDITCDEYRLPFEEEICINPSIEDMQEIVAQQKRRPKILDVWLKHYELQQVVCTIQDCWDQEAEARLSAQTICERMNHFILKNDTSGPNRNSNNNHQF